MTYLDHYLDIDTLDLHISDEYSVYEMGNIVSRYLIDFIYYG